MNQEFLKRAANRTLRFVAPWIVKATRYLNIIVQDIFENFFYAVISFIRAIGWLTDLFIDPFSNLLTRVLDAISSFIKRKIPEKYAKPLIMALNIFAYVGFAIVLNTLMGGLGTFLIPQLSPIMQLPFVATIRICLDVNFILATVTRAVLQINRFMLKFVYKTEDLNERQYADLEDQGEIHSIRRANIIRRNSKYLYNIPGFNVIEKVANYVPTFFVTSLVTTFDLEIAFLTQAFTTILAKVTKYLFADYLPEAVQNENQPNDVDVYDMFESYTISSRIKLLKKNDEHILDGKVNELELAKNKILPLVHADESLADSYRRSITNELRILEPRLRKIESAQEAYKNNLLLVRAQNWISEKINALFTNNFDKAVELAILNKDFSQITNYIKSMDRGEYRNYVTYGAGIHWNARLVWEIKNSKYDLDKYWLAQGISNERLCDLSTVHEDLCCPTITKNLMPIPACIVTANDTKTFVDLRALLMMIIEGKAYNPHTNEPINSLDALQPAWTKYVKLQNLVARENNVPETPLPTFDEVLQQALDANDFKILAYYLNENGAKIQGDGNIIKWDWNEIKEQFVNSKFNKRIDPELEEQLYKAAAESEKEAFSERLIIVPVYFYKSNGDKYYMDLFQLLESKQVNDKHPLQEGALDLDAVYIDKVTYNKLLDMRANPIKYINDYKRLQACNYLDKKYAKPPITASEVTDAQPATVLTQTQQPTNTARL